MAETLGAPIGNLRERTPDEEKGEVVYET